MTFQSFYPFPLRRPLALLLTVLTFLFAALLPTRARATETSDLETASAVRVAFEAYYWRDLSLMRGGFSAMTASCVSVVCLEEGLRVAAVPYVQTDPDNAEGAPLPDYYSSVGPVTGLSLTFEPLQDLMDRVHPMVFGRADVGPSWNVHFNDPHGNASGWLGTATMGIGLASDGVLLSVGVGVVGDTRVSAAHGRITPVTLSGRF